MEFCNGPLWDNNLTWYTTDPDFTPCFHQVVLSSIPLIFLAILSPFEIYFSYNSTSRPIPWGLRNIVRTVGITLIYILSASELILTVKSSRKLQQSDIIEAAVELTSLFGSLLFCIMNIKTSRKWLTVAIFRKWQDSSVALWIEIAVILNWR